MRESLKTFLDSDKPGLYFCGHASALVKIGRDIVLFDPIWQTDDPVPYENFLFHPKQVDCSDILRRVTAVVCSHEHADHWSPSILEALPCPVYITDGRPRFHKRIAKHCDVIEYPRMRWTKLFSSDVEIFFVPNPRNTVDSSCLLRGGGFCAYVGSDNFLDRKLCQEVSMAAGVVDVACIPWQFVHFFPSLIEMEQGKKNAEAMRLKRQSIDDARMFMDIVRPRATIPFGGNLLWCEGPDHPLNTILAKPSELPGALPLNSGDFIIKENWGTRSYTYPVTDMPEWKPLLPMDFAVELSDRELTSIISRVRKAPANVPCHAIVVNDAVTIDCQEKRAYDGVLDGVLRDRKVHRFYFDAGVFREWARGRITFETALGSRRFKYSRSPDEYSLQLTNWWANFL